MLKIHGSMNPARWLASLKGKEHTDRRHVPIRGSCGLKIAFSEFILFTALFEACVCIRIRHNPWASKDSDMQSDLRKSLRDTNDRKIVWNPQESVSQSYWMIYEATVKALRKREIWFFCSGYRSGIQMYAECPDREDAWKNACRFLLDRLQY